MKKIYSEQLYFMESGESFLIDIVVNNDEITDIIASEDIQYKNYKFQKGDIINCNGDNSMIRSEDISISELI